MKIYTYTAKASRDFYIYAESKEEAEEILERTGIYLDIEEAPNDRGSVYPDETYGTETEFVMEESAEG